MESVEDSPDSTPEADPQHEPPTTDSSATEEIAEPLSEEETRPNIPPRRLMVFTPVGPLLVDLRIAVGGEPLDAVVEGLVAEFVAGIDSDGDGVATWEELRGYSGASNMSATDRRRVREVYDFDGDRRVDPDEAIAWSENANNGGVAPGLSVLGGMAYSRGDMSPLWRVLDLDADGTLGPDEIAGSAESLLRRDVDDDLVIRPFELLRLADLIRQRGDPAFQVDDSADPSDSTYRAALLIDRARDALIGRDAMAVWRATGRDAFGPFARSYDQLDLNGDGYLTKQEWQGLQSVDPVVTLSVDFSDGDPSEAAPFRVDIPNDQAPIRLSPYGDAWLLSVPATDTHAAGEVLVSLVDEGLGGEGSRGVEAPSADPLQRLGLVRVAVVVNDNDDGMFALLDTDRDGRLGELEIASVPELLRQGDQNGDGALDSDETPWRMAVTIFRTQRQLQFDERAPVSGAAQREEAPPWFIGADANADGVVSRREYLGPLDRFTESDTNDDGFLTPDEAP